MTGKDSGVYQATPLSRLNTADGMTTPLAQEAYEQFYETMCGKPVHGLPAPGCRGPDHRRRA